MGLEPLLDSEKQYKSKQESNEILTSTEQTSGSVGGRVIVLLGEDDCALLGKDDCTLLGEDDCTLLGDSVSSVGRNVGG